MTYNLATAILDHSTGWELLLGQIGLPYRAIHNVSELSVENFAVVIVNRHLWVEEHEALEAFVREGGAVLDIGRFLPARDSSAFHRKRIGTVYCDNIDGVHLDDAFLDIECRALAHRSGERLEGLVHTESLGAGFVCFVGFDPGERVLDTGASMRRFPAVREGVFPAERVARLSKGGIMRLVRSLLQQLFQLRGLPFVSKRVFPGDASNVLCFRIDSDYGSREQIDALYELARSTNAKMTWFLHLEAHQDWLGHFRTFEEQEIALHCLRHRTFPDFHENDANITEGLKVLGKEEIPVQGFSAPNGIWNHGLAEAIDRQGFLYSSEFSLAYDALPFYPPLQRMRRVNRRFYGALQIPIHPVSVGNLARVGATEADMAEYYRAVVGQKVGKGEPLIFYHHPTHERWDVMRALLTEAQSYGPACLTFGEYARWWKLRQECLFDAVLQDGTLVISSRRRDPSVWFDVTTADGIPCITGEDGNVIQSGRAEESMLQTATVPKFEIADGLRGFSMTTTRRALHDWIIRTRR